MTNDARETLQELTLEGQKKGFVPEFGLSPKYPENALTEAHAALLEASGVSPKVAVERGYCSVLNGEFFKELVHVPQWEKRVPCLMIPIWDARGSASQLQIRPDTPRLVNGKKVKYESLPAANLCLDIPPFIFDQLANPKIPLWITEGSRKADAAVSHGLCCISLIGVWGFRGKNKDGGKTSLADWEAIALNDRVVKVAYDSDASTKPGVARALDRLRQFLVSRGATVKIVYLPDSEDDSQSKMGLDDYLATHTVASLEDLVCEATESISSSGAPTYIVQNGCFALFNGENAEKLCNFTAKIVLAETRDDGVLQTPFYHIQGTTDKNTSLPTVVVPAEEFLDMKWMEKAWLTDITCNAGRSTREHIAAAIKLFSKDGDRQTTYLHTGWKVLADNSYAYLHGGDILTAGGQKVHVLLDGSLGLTVLERGEVDARSVIQKFLELGPHSLVVPLLAGVFCAALGEFLKLDFAFHIEGPTGSMKSELASLMQGFWGKGYRRETLPANWSSTFNSLERQSFDSKDMIFVVDDYAPQPGKQAQLALAQKAEVIFRAAGNQAGRGRLSHNLEQRATYYPRGLILSTGEDTISGVSLSARIISLHVNKNDLNSREMYQLADMRAAGKLTNVMMGFLEWVGPRAPLDLTAECGRHHDKLRHIVPEAHRRHTNALSKLMVAWELLGTYLDWPELLEIGEGAIVHANQEQNDRIAEEDIAIRAMDRLRAALKSGEGYLEVLETASVAHGDDYCDRYGYKKFDGTLRNMGTRLGHVGPQGQEYLDPVKCHETIWRDISSSRRGVASALEVAGYFRMKDGRSYVEGIRHRGIIAKVYVLYRPIYEVDVLNQNDYLIPENLTMRGFDGLI